MGWSNRGSRRYYYESTREGDRVRTRYLGKGPLGEAAAILQEARRRDCEQAASADRAERDRLESEDRAAAAVFEGVGLVVGLALEAAGFRQHHRGEWRRTRMAKKTLDMPATLEAPPPATRGEILDVMARSRKGDAGALRRLRELFAVDRDRMIRATGGELAVQVEHSLVAKFSGDGKDPLWEETLRRKMEDLRAELGGSNPSPIERLLAERVALCWLDAHHCDLVHHQAESHTFARAEHYQKARDRAHRRYLSALRALASVRKMGPLTAVQINAQFNLERSADAGEGGRPDLEVPA